MMTTESEPLFPLAIDFVTLREVFADVRFEEFVDKYLAYEFADASSYSTQQQQHPQPQPHSQSIMMEPDTFEEKLMSIQVDEYLSISKSPVNDEGTRPMANVPIPKPETRPMVSPTKKEDLPFKAIKKIESARVVWTRELHLQFIQAVEALGEEHGKNQISPMTVDRDRVHKREIDERESMGIGPI